MELNNDTLNELNNYAKELLYDHLYDTIKTNMSMLDEKNRYYNWYYGYTRIHELPYYHSYWNRVNYEVRTVASSGSISTQHFGEKFNADNVQKTNLLYNITIHPPDNVIDNENVTLHLEIELISMKHLSTGKDVFKVDGEEFTADKPNFAYNYSLPKEFEKNILLERSDMQNADAQASVKRQKLNLMPGFRLTWNYHGMGVNSMVPHYNDTISRAFVRNGSNLFKILIVLHYHM